MSIYEHEMFRTGIIKNQPIHEELHHLAEVRYGMHILYSEYDFGSNQAHLDLYVSDVDEALVHSAGRTDGIVPADAFPRRRELLEDWKLLLEKYGRQSELRADTWLNIYRFSYFTIAAAVTGMGAHLRQAHPFPYDMRIISLPDLSTNFVFESLAEYCRAEQEDAFSGIRKVAYELAKKYDPFGYLTRENFIINFYDRQTMDRNLRNVMAMESG